MALCFDGPRLQAYLYSRGAGWFSLDSTAFIGWEVSGKVTGAVAFYQPLGRNLFASIALDGGAMPRGLLRACAHYCVRQLDVCRLTFMISSNNLRSIKLATDLGACREATLPDGCADGDLLIFCLRPEQSSFWSYFYEKRKPAEST